jgi:hypothetical protein
MYEASKFADRFRLEYDAPRHRRLIAGKEVILHCHHYNSRLQSTIESATAIDGRKIITSSAEAVFAEHVAQAVRPTDDRATKWNIAHALYAHLGYGDLDFSAIEDGVVTAAASHFVEGWNAGFPDRTDPVCTFTEGFLQGALHAIEGERAYFRETECAIVSGKDRCRFERVSDRNEPIASFDKQKVDSLPVERAGHVTSPNVDSERIVAALVEMPIHGDAEGLIPAFGVYLASTPADFYNLICIRFIEEMGKHGLERTARRLLVADAETCAMNTFRGIMSSPEWDGLVAPMIKDTPDNLFGVVAVSNALGWGDWHVAAHVPGASLRMVSLNGYEAVGFREYRGTSDTPQCAMLTGVAAGFMELVYGKGSIEERFGTYASTEQDCLCKQSASCTFDVEKL